MIDVNLLYNVQAERAVLGAILLHDNAIERIWGTLEPRDFFNKQHVLIFKRMQELSVAGTRVDALTLSMSLTQEELDVVDKAYVAGLTSDLPSAAAITDYARIVTKLSQDRALIESCNVTPSVISEDNGTREAAITTLIERAQKCRAGAGSWSTPQELPMLLPEAPSMTPEFLPGPLREWLTDISNRKQIPLEIPAAAAVVALAAVLGRKCAILPKRRDDWLVVPNLWGMIVARSGMLKTPAIHETLKPLGQLSVETHAEYERNRASIVAEGEIQKAKLDAIRSAIKSAAKDKNEEALRQLSQDLAELERTSDGDVNYERRLKVNDCTVEKLCELLRDNPDGLLLFRDELSGWLRSLDKQGREGDREFFLESWDGTGEFKQDRIGRGTVYVPHVCLSILGGIQPGKLSSYVEDAVAGKRGDDGLLQRFQVAVYPERRHEWHNVDDYPRREARERAGRIFSNVYYMTPTTLGVVPPKYEDVPALRFDDGAQDLFNDWLERLQSRIYSDEIGSPEFESHLAKYRSLMPTLALIFHLVDWADNWIDKAFATTIPDVAADPTQKAIAWCEFLEAHARKIYSGLIAPDLRAAHALAQKILAGKVRDGDPLRAIYRSCWSGLRDKTAILTAISMLTDAGWVRIVTDKTGGRPTDVIRINPTLEITK